MSALMPQKVAFRRTRDLKLRSTVKEQLKADVIV